MRKVIAGILAFATVLFLSPGGSRGVLAQVPDQMVGLIKATMEGMTDKQRLDMLSQKLTAELVDANGKVIATQAHTADGMFNFSRVQPGTYTVRLKMTAAFFGTQVDNPPVFDAGSAFVTVNAGATANVGIAVTQTALAAAASAAAAAGGTTTTSAGSFSLLGMGTAGSVLSIGAVAGLIAGIALTRDGESSPSR